jgi:pantothenate kinase
MDTPNHFKLETDDLQSIKELAKEIDCPVEEVNRIYISTLRLLKSSARIQDYVHVLASKKVRDELRH